MSGHGFASVKIALFTQLSGSRLFCKTRGQCTLEKEIFEFTYSYRAIGEQALEERVVVEVEVEGLGDPLAGLDVVERQGTEQRLDVRHLERQLLHLELVREPPAAIRKYTTKTHESIYYAAQSQRDACGLGIYQRKCEGALGRHVGRSLAAWIAGRLLITPVLHRIVPEHVVAVSTLMDDISDQRKSYMCM